MFSLFSKITHAYMQVYGYYIFRRKVGVLGKFMVVNPQNVKIGDNCGVNHDVFILGGGRVEIGSNVVLSAGAMIIDSGLNTVGYSQVEYPEHKNSFVIIEDGVWVGARALILPGVTIGRKSIVGAGSVVTRDVPPFTIVAGNPAKPIGRTDV